MSERSAAELLRSYTAGDVAAFAALVDRYQSELLRYARFLPGAADPEDVVQEVFLRLARNPPRLPAEADGNERLAQAHLASWLFKVTRNCAMELVRSEIRRQNRERTAAPPEATPHGGQDRVDAQDTRDAVEAGLLRLPDDQREVLVLRLLGERSYRDIAEITGKKPGTVAWLISEGLKALGRILAPSLAMDLAAEAEIERPARPAGGSR